LRKILDTYLFRGIMLVCVPKEVRGQRVAKHSIYAGRGLYWLAVTVHGNTVGLGTRSRFPSDGNRVMSPAHPSWWIGMGVLSS